ncbi:hypothetical protein Pla175_02340 [Pirellulimonas nuda]|uniref:Uncharacterized protein n=1 Tax=Pirellulimonas nuda TaxID=2528009 RepID=A0A518D5Z2_9BACT|nr:hypothetical protein [Pirellulimonas nuda]QDU86880.1 hypothetical protein Pla175_02340 [Pirellulimonas nuda]
MQTDLVSLTTALLALVDAGDGIAELVDPETNRVVRIVEAPPAGPALSDEEIREKLEEARADFRAGRFTTGSRARLNQ